VAELSTSIKLSVMAMAKCLRMGNIVVDLSLLEHRSFLGNLYVDRDRIKVCSVSRWA